MFPSNRLPSLWFCCLSLLASGCARMVTLRAENEKIATFAKIEGNVSVEHWKGDPLVVAVMIKPAHMGAPITVKNQIPLNRPGYYSALLEPNVYMLAVFEDANHNQRYDTGERAAAFEDFGAIDVSGAGASKHIDLTITDELPPFLRQPIDVEVLRPLTVGEGTVLALSDPRFAPENAELGVWEPATFYEKVGMGLFMLEPYDASRIPVLFVHGMGGHPREFETLIGCLDKKRFQPWVAQYASGWALAPVARGMNYVLTKLQRKHGFPKVYVVAHSMGGLVARGMLREHLRANPTPFVTKLVTINSPLGGMSSADTGVSMAPAVVPSWRDIGPRSDYVKKLYAEPLPASIDYSLFFSFHEDEASDGVVALASQLRAEARREASHLVAFEGTHAGVLKDPELCTALIKELSR